VIDVEFVFRRDPAAVLTAKIIAQHHVTPSESHRRSAVTGVAAKAHDPRCTQGASHGADGIVMATNRKVCPSGDIVKFAVFVEQARGAGEQQANGAPDADDGHGLKGASDDEHRQRKCLATAASAQTRHVAADRITNLADFAHFVRRCSSEQA
jgi:hypothetical protein